MRRSKNSTKNVLLMLDNYSERQNWLRKMVESISSNARYGWWVGVLISPWLEFLKRQWNSQDLALLQSELKNDFLGKELAG